MFQMLKLLFILLFSFLSMINCNSSNRNESELVDSLERQASASFISVWRISQEGEAITLPLRSEYNYDFTVDWGDGSSSEITAYDDTDITHIYASAGEYRVIISGILEAWYFNNSGSKDQLISVLSLGDVGWRDLEAAFYGCENLEEFGGGDVSNVANMSYMFAGTSLVELDMNGWQFGNVTDMSLMFTGVTLPTEIYSFLLNQIYATSQQNGVNFDGGDSKYNESAVTARGALIDRGWLIVDGGRDDDGDGDPGNDDDSGGDSDSGGDGDQGGTPPPIDVELPPTVVSVLITSTPSGAYHSSGKIYGPEETIEMTVAFSEMVLVDTAGGTPILEFNIGSLMKEASYSSGTGTRELIFTYTVVEKDQSFNGVELFRDKLNANGGRMTSVRMQDADLSHAGFSSNGDHRVGDIARIRKIEIRGIPPNGVYGIGDAMNLVVYFTKQVQERNRYPDVIVEVGSQQKKFRMSGRYQDRLFYKNVLVREGDLDEDGIRLPSNFMDTSNGENVYHGNKEPIFTEFSAWEPPSVLKVDGIRPTITQVSITSTPASGNTYEAGETIEMTLEFDKVVKVATSAGRPKLTVAIGGETRQAVYQDGSDTNRLTFIYVVDVTTRDRDTDGIHISEDSLSLNKGTIRGVMAGNNASLTHMELPTQINHQVDTGPYITHVAITSSPTKDNIYGPGEKIQITLTFNEEVLVAGVPRVTIRMGTKEKPAKKELGTRFTKIVFSYTVEMEDHDDDGIDVYGLTRGSIISAQTRRALYREYDSLVAQSEHKIDGESPPFIVKTPWISSTPTAKNVNTYGPGENIEVTVRFDKSVVVTGKPKLFFWVGTSVKPALYNRGSNSTDIVFAYEVGSLDQDLNGINMLGHSIYLRSGRDTIRSRRGIHAVLDHGPFGHQFGHRVGLFSRILGITMRGGPANNQFYVAGEEIKIVVRLSHRGSYIAGDPPKIKLHIGKSIREARYVTGITTNSFWFKYTVKESDFDINGITIPANAFPLRNNGETSIIRDTPPSSPFIFFNLDHLALVNLEGRRVNVAVGGGKL